MRNCIVLFFLFSGFLAAGQVLKGKITAGKNGEALPWVTVIADDTTGVQADSAGNYMINLSPGIHQIEFRMVSFQSEKRTVTLIENEDLTLNITLNESARMMDVVVITAGKFEQRLEDVTVSMEVLRPEIIERKNVIAMDEAVDYIPGVSIIDGQANIRGGSGWSYGAGSRVQILVDDLPQLTADANDTKWNFLPVENLEQVEVIKGASSVLFGSSALNGVINIRTGYPRDTPVTKINTFAGFYDKAYITTDKKYSLNYQDKLSKYAGVNFYHSRKINRLDFVVGGNALNDGGYRQGENEKRARINVNTRYHFKIPGLTAGVNFNTMAVKSTIFFLWQNDTTGAFIPAANTLSDSKTNRTNIDPFLTYVNTKGTSHKLRTRWFNSTNKNNTNQNSRGDLYYYEYQYQKRFKNFLTLTGGLVSIHSKVKSQLYGDHDGIQYAGYLQGDIRWNKISFSGGMRVERSEVDSIINNWTPVFRSGINYHLFSYTYFRASVGQGYRFPSIAERFIKTSVSGANIFPNPELEPEKGVSFEAGVKQMFKAGNVSGYIDGAIFQNNYENMMEFVFAQWEPSLPFLQDIGFKSLNVGKTRIKGYEISVVAEVRLSGNTTISFQAGYTYIDPKQITYDSLYVTKVGTVNSRGSDNNDFLKYRSRHLFKTEADVFYKKYFAGASVRYASRMENMDIIFTNGLLDFLFPPGLGIADYRKYRTGGDLITDFRAGYFFSMNNNSATLKLSLIVKNAFNHIYMQRPADMQPPRSFALQAGINF
jgi:iron complex outermembrane receptor protein